MDPVSLAQPDDILTLLSEVALRGNSLTKDQLKIHFQRENPGHTRHIPAGNGF